MSKKNNELPDLPDDWTDDDLAALLLDAARRKPDKNPKPPAKWLPSLSPGQMEVFFDETNNTLVCGTRLTGKGYACGYNLVKHCYDYNYAHVLIIVKTKRQGNTGGFFSKLGADILPDFEQNVEGFTFKGPFQSIDKDQIYTVKNRFGGTSVLQMVSVQHDQDITKKAKGIEVTKVYIDEGQLFQSKIVYQHLRGTLKRTRKVPLKAQTVIISCNPDAPGHWLNETFDVLTPEKRKPGFRVIEIMAKDNPDQELVINYHQQLIETFGAESVQVKRDVHGLWVDVPAGDALFSGYFMPEVHVIGNMADGTGLSPVAGLPIGIGMDPGDKNHGVVLFQEIPTKEGLKTIIFDEVSIVGEAVSLETLTRRIMQRINKWGEMVDFSFSTVSVSDQSAFVRFRAGTGSFDCAEIERHWREAMPSFSRIKYPLRIQECPKGNGSVEFGTKLMRDMFTRGELLVSATHCKAVMDMLQNITGTAKNALAPDTHCPRKHIFDAMRYFLVFQRAGGPVVESNTIKPEVIRVGR